MRTRRRLIISVKRKTEMVKNKCAALNKIIGEIIDNPKFNTDELHNILLDLNEIIFELHASSFHFGLDDDYIALHLEDLYLVIEEINGLEQKVEWILNNPK